MTAAHLRTGLHLIYRVAPLVRLACTERSGYACSESEWPSITVVTSFSKILFAATRNGQQLPARGGTLPLREFSAETVASFIVAGSKPFDLYTLHSAVACRAVH